jgi:NADH dehydrogenase
MILVIGSTGMVGSEVCRLLISKNLPVRAMVRSTSDSSKRNKLKDLGVQIVEGDIRDKSTFPKILEGITTVITTVSAMPFSYVPGENDIRQVDEEGMINFIDEAKKAGVKHFIYTSFSKNFNLDFPLSISKRKVEKYLKNSGLNYTILRPSCFMEVWLSPAVGFDAVNGKVNLCGDGTKPIAYISFKDVAKFAAECVSNAAAVNTVLELGGPEKLSQLDAVKIFGDTLHKKMEMQHIPLETLMVQLNSAEDVMQKSFTGLMICVAKGDLIDMKEVMRKFPIKLTSVKEYVGSLV